MHSRRQYIITKNEVHGYANYWLEKSLRLEYKGTKCTASTLLQVLLIAASRTVSVFAAASLGGAFAFEAIVTQLAYYFARFVVRPVL